MAIVWPCTMTAHDYAAAGKDVSVPRPDCPACGAAMIFFGTYTRPLLVVIELRLVIRRAQCSPCKVSHALLPDFVAVARLDGIEVIGSLVEQSAAGHSTIGVAQRVDVPYTTARGWRRRLEERAGLLGRGLLAVTVALGDLVPKLAVGELAALFSAIGSAVKAAAGVSGPGHRDARRPPRALPSSAGALVAVPRIAAPTVKEHHDHQHEAILDAVGSILAEEGYAGMELAGVGQRVGLARTSLYRYARHKDELVAQWLQRVFRPAIAGAQAALGGAGHLPIGSLSGSTDSWTSPPGPATAPPPV